jgi:hypothetical protein
MSARISMLALLTLSTPAFAGPGRVDMTSASEVSSAGFEHIIADVDDDPVANFADGKVTFGPGSFDEMMVTRWDHPEHSWWRDVNPANGWWVEATVTMESSSCALSGGGHGLWISDGHHLVIIALSDDDIAVRYPVFLNAGVGVGDGFHRVRVEALLDRTVHVLLDDVEVVAPFSISAGGGTEALSFGKLSSCGGSSTWDALEWDTFLFGRGSDDDDGDGLLNNADRCPFIANPDQADVDGDRQGDVCDPCPSDARDDIDGDGMCESEDPCPLDVENIDSDDDGTCDDEDRCPNDATD